MSQKQDSHTIKTPPISSVPDVGSKSPATSFCPSFHRSKSLSFLVPHVKPFKVYTTDKQEICLLPLQCIGLYDLATAAVRNFFFCLEIIKLLTRYRRPFQSMIAVFCKWLSYFYLNKALGLRMRDVTWNRFPLKQVAGLIRVCHLCGDYLFDFFTSFRCIYHTYLACFEVWCFLRCSHKNCQKSSLCYVHV